MLVPFILAYPPKAGWFSGQVLVTSSPAGQHARTSRCSVLIDFPVVFDAKLQLPAGLACNMGTCPAVPDRPMFFLLTSSKHAQPAT